MICLAIARPAVRTVWLEEHFWGVGGEGGCLPGPNYFPNNTAGIVEFSRGHDITAD